MLLINTNTKLTYEKESLNIDGVNNSTNIN